MQASERRESPLPSVRRGRPFANTSFRALTATAQIAAPSAPWSSEPPSTVGLPHHARTLPDASCPRHGHGDAPQNITRLGSGALSSGAIFQLIGAAAPCPIPAKRDIGVGSVAPRAARIFDTADGVQPLGQACGRWCTPWLPVRCLACGKCAPPPSGLGCGEDKNLQRPSPSRSHPLTW